MVTILIFIAVLGVVIFLHELGHFLTARRLGVQVEEFGFGFPPRLAGKRIRGVLYSINWIPFGGFVRLKGEQASEHDEDPTSFQNARRWHRTAIIVAGVVMNFLLAVVLFTVVFSFGVPALVDDAMTGAHLKDPRPYVTVVLDDAPAQAAGFAGGESIRAINGTGVATADDVRSIIEQSVDQPLTFTTDSDGTAHELTVTPHADDAGLGKIGAGLEDVATISYPIHWAFLHSVRTSVEMVGLVLVAFGTLVKDLVIHQTVPADIAGPVGIAVLTGQVAEQGIIALLQFIAVLSLSLGVINVLPIPGLDGGRLFFLGIEALRGRPIGQRTEAIIHNVGFVLMILLLIVVSIQDVDRFQVGQRIGDAFRSIFR